MERELTKADKYTAIQRLEMCIEMLDSPTARESEILEIDKYVIPALVKAQTDLGFDPKEDKFSHLLENISTEIKNSTPFIRLAEIPIAIHSGVLGDHGDFYGLSVVSVIKFIKSHHTSAKRAEIVKIKPVKEEEKPIPTKEEQKETAKQHIIEAFEKYKSEKKIGYSWVYLYRWLNEEFKAINFTNEIKWKIYYQAIIKYLASKETGTLADYISSANRNDAKILKEYIKNEPDHIQCAKKVAGNFPNKMVLIAIKNESECIAVSRLFDDLIEMETEITDLLNY